MKRAENNLGLPSGLWYVTKCCMLAELCDMFSRLIPHANQAVLAELCDVCITLLPLTKQAIGCNGML